MTTTIDRLRRDFPELEKALTPERQAELVRFVQDGGLYETYNDEDDDWQDVVVVNFFTSKKEVQEYEDLTNSDRYAQLDDDGKRKAVEDWKVSWRERLLNEPPSTK